MGIIKSGILNNGELVPQNNVVYALPKGGTCLLKTNFSQKSNIEKLPKFEILTILSFQSCGEIMHFLNFLCNIIIFYEMTFNGLQSQTACNITVQLGM